MTEQEKAFWEIWNKIEPHFSSYNHRQMFDFGYRAAMERVVEKLEAELVDASKVGIFSADAVRKVIANVKGEN